MDYWNVIGIGLCVSLFIAICVLLYGLFKKMDERDDDTED